MKRKFQRLSLMHPYLVGTGIACALNLAWLIILPLRMGLMGFVISALPLSATIGAAKVRTKGDVYWQWPLAALCYAFVAVFYSFFGMMIEGGTGDGKGFVFLVMPIITLFASPILLVGLGAGNVRRKQNDETDVRE